MFMQAGFALLEAGLTRMKNVGHVAAKNVLTFALATIVFYLVGFGIAFGDGGNGLFGGSGFAPSVEELVAVGAAPFSWFASLPGAAAMFFQAVFCGVSLAIVWGAMAERTKLWVYFAFSVVYTVIYSVVAHWIWGANGWLAAQGMQDFAGSTVVHYQGALAGLAGAILLGARVGKFSADGKPNAIPGHNMPLVGLAVLILWFGWFGFNAGSTLGAIGVRFADVVVVTQLGAAMGVLGAMLTSYLITRKFDIGMSANGAIAGLVAITAPSGYIEYWAAPLIGLVAGVVVVGAIIAIDRKLDDPVGALSAHGIAGIWGTLACGLFTSPRLAELNAIGEGGLFYTGSFEQLGVQALGVAAAFATVFTVSYLVFWAIKKTYGLRVAPEEERYGLDIVEHGMWGYPEQFMPVPGSEYRPPAMPSGWPPRRPQPVTMPSTRVQEG
jgi:ammonium transporter, Amt family